MASPFANLIILIDFLLVWLYKKANMNCKKGCIKSQLTEIKGKKKKKRKSKK